MEINKAITKNVENYVDFDHPEIKSFMNTLSKKGYGEVYFNVAVNEDGELYPTGITVDGVWYDAKDEKQIQKLVEVFDKMKQAVEKVDTEYTSFESLPNHISPDIYKYHPRWMAIRRLEGVTSVPDGSIKCRMKQIMTKESWERFCFLSTGQRPMNISYIASDYLMTEQEYSAATLENARATSLNFQRSFYETFMSNYIGDIAKTTRLTELYNKLRNTEDETEFNETIDCFHAEALSISEETTMEASEKVGSLQYHQDFLAFQDVLKIMNLAKQKRLTGRIKLDTAKDGFPIVKLGSKKYDFRKSVDISCFEHDFCVKYGYSR